MTITNFIYMYGIIISKKSLEENKDLSEDKETVKSKFDYVDIPHDTHPAEFGLDDDKKCEDYIVIGKIITTIEIGLGKIKIPNLSKVLGDKEKQEYNFILREMTNSTEYCDYITIPNDCNCCS